MELFLDGMHHYGTAQIGKKWTAAYAGSIPTNAFTVTADGRSVNCITSTAIATSGTAGYLTCAPLMTNYGPWTPTDSGVCGFAIRVQDLTKLSADGVRVKQLFALFEGGGRIFYVVLNQNGTFSHYYHEEAPFDSGYVGSSIQGLRSDTWAYVEFKWTIGLTEGRWETRLNTVKIFDIQDAQAAGDRRVYGTSNVFSYLGVWDAVLLLQLPMTSTTNTKVRMCDFYLADQEEHGGDYVVKDFLGDSTIGAIYPEDVGTYAEWTASPANPNWQNVSEHPPDDDTTVVTASAGGTRDRHVMQDVPAGAVILGYQSLIYAKKASVGAAILDPVLRVGGTDYVFDGQGATSPDEYYYIIQPHDNNPATGAQATEGDINAMEAGYNKE